MTNASAARAERDRRIVELRALGWTHQVIADEVRCSRQTVTKVLTPTARERERDYRVANAERIKNQQQDYRQRNRDRIRQRVRRYGREHVGDKAAYDREYRKANAGRIAAYQADYREKNGPKIRERNRRYRAARRQEILGRRRKSWAARANELNAKRRVLYDDSARERVGRYRRGNLEAHRAIGARRRMRALMRMDAIDRLLSVEYRKAIASDACTYCGTPGEHDDHMLPLARGGTDHWWNLQRTCKDCNFRKHTMTHEEFVASGRAPDASAA